MKQDRWLPHPKARSPMRSPCMLTQEDEEEDKVDREAEVETPMGEETEEARNGIN